MKLFATRALSYAIVVAGAGILSPPKASAEPAKIVAGVLTCKGDGGIGLIIGSKQTLKCNFNPSDKSPARSYTATITKVGLDVGIKGKSTIVWTVLSSSTNIPAEALQGNYAGVSADASIGVGGGANVLVGGSKDSVVLQPLSIQGETGLNLAVGVTGLSLKNN